MIWQIKVIKDRYKTKVIKTFYNDEYEPVTKLASLIWSAWLDQSAEYEVATNVWNEWTTVNIWTASVSEAFNSSGSIGYISMITPFEWWSIAYNIWLQNPVTVNYTSWDGDIHIKDEVNRLWWDWESADSRTYSNSDGFGTLADDATVRQVIWWWTSAYVFIHNPITECTCFVYNDIDKAVELRSIIWWSTIRTLVVWLTPEKKWYIQGWWLYYSRDSSTEWLPADEWENVIHYSPNGNDLYLAPNWVKEPEKKIWINSMLTTHKWINK